MRRRLPSFLLTFRFNPSIMKRFVLLGALALCLSLSSCQCSNKPPIGPVEDDALQSHVDDADASDALLISPAKRT